jgi:hypothetical protein
MRQRGAVIGVTPIARQDDEITRIITLDGETQLQPDLRLDNFFAVLFEDLACPEVQRLVQGKVNPKTEEINALFPSNLEQELLSEIFQAARRTGASGRIASVRVKPTPGPTEPFAVLDIVTDSETRRGPSIAAAEAPGERPGN